MEHHDTIEITLIVEHGFAAWIETGGDCFLFDTGQGCALEHNARALGINLGRAHALILSHPRPLRPNRRHPERSGGKYVRTDHLREGHRPMSLQLPSRSSSASGRHG